MSGTSISVTSSASANGGQNNGSGIGAIAGALMVGAVVLPIGVAALTVAAVAKGTAGLTKWGISKYRRHKAREAELQAENERRLAEYRAERERTRHKIAQAASAAGIPAADAASHPAMQAVLNGHQEQLAEQSKYLDTFEANQVKAFADMHTHLAETVANAASRYDLSKALIDQTDRLFAKWDAQSQKVQEQYADVLREKQHKADAELISSYQSLLEEARSLKTNAAVCDQKMQELAARALQDAAQLICETSELRGTAVFAADDLSLYRTAYEAAAAYYGDRRYDLAFGKARDVILQVQETSQDVLQKTFSSDLKRNRLTVRAALLAESLENLKDLRYLYEGEEYIIDITEYHAEGFAAIEKSISAVLTLLDRELPMTAQELSAADEEIAALETGFSAIYCEARRRMETSVSDVHIGRHIVAALKEQGFSLDDSCFDAKDALCVNLRNRVDDTNVTARIHGSRIELYNFGADGREADVHQQKAVRQAVERELSIVMQCEDLGMNATAYNERDLKMKRLEAKKKNRKLPALKKAASRSNIRSAK